MPSTAKAQAIENLTLDLGLEEAPAGVGELRVKELRFIEGYLQAGNATEAAVRAGYTDNRDAAGVQAARLLGNARIKRVLSQAAQRVSQNVEKMLIRVWERAQTWHNRQNELIEQARRIEDGLPAMRGLLQEKENSRELGADRLRGQIADAEDRADKLWREARYAAQEAERADKLLAMILGRIDLTVNLNQQNHNVFAAVFQGEPVTPDMCRQLAESYRADQEAMLKPAELEKN